MPGTRVPARLPHLAAYALAFVFAAQLAFTLRVAPPSVVFGGEPIATADYSLHFSRAAAADEFLTRAHRSWGYDPHFMAGYPMGTVLDVNHKLVEILVHGLHGAGVPLATAFNLLVFSGILLAPVLMWLSARLLGLGGAEQLAATALTTALWVLDSEVGKTWRVGVLASGVAMYTLPVVLACLYRFYTDRSIPRFLLLALVGSFVSLLHPLSFVFFVAALVPFVVIVHRTLDRRLFSAMIALSATVALVNLFWVLPFLRDLPYKTASGYHWIGDLSALRRDLLGVRDSGLRLVIYLLALGGFTRWWSEGHRDRVRLMLPLVGVLTACGYVAGELPVFRDLETYRCNLITSFLLCFPAASFVAYAVRWAASIEPRWRLLGTAVTAGLVLNLTGRNLAQLGPIIEGGHSLGPLGEDEMATVQWLREHAHAGRRVMVEYWPLGALVPWYTGLEVIGGPYPLAWVQHNFANFASLRDAGVPDAVRLFGRSIGEFSPAQLRAYLDSYNVGWIVAYTDTSKDVFDRASWLQSVHAVGAYRIYQSRDSSGAMLRGTGRVAAGYDGMRVAGASLGDLVLKYHWSPLLTSDPPQAIEPYAVLDDPVPFMRLPDNRFTDFVIRN